MIEGPRPSARYRILRPLGRGSMGIVYAAHDLVLDRTVALKTLIVQSPEEIYRLKKEFRALARISHENLAQLYDLVVEEEHCFFTMELVRGAALSEHLARHERGGAPFRRAFLQLATAIDALHREGKLHRDIKPTNVLVDEDGRVVLLDFGLVSSISSRISMASRRGVLEGTLAYMAPEQLWGAALSPASDWYSFGVLLYEALTGQIPYDGLGLRTLVAEPAPRLPPPREIAPDAPADLEALCLRLLERDAARRPAAEETLAVLSARAGARGAAPGTASPPFVGRERELEVLREALKQSRGALTSIRVIGPSGIGKTALVESFLDEDARGDILALRSSCHPRESLPYRALDGIVDDLTRILLHSFPERIGDLLPAGLPALQRIFPVLGRLGGPGRSPARPGAAPDVDRGAPDDPGVFAQMEAHEVRHQAFGALHELLARLSAIRPIVAWIDDFQWADLDSLAFLRTLFATPDAIRLLLIVAHRSEASDQAPAIVELDRLLETNAGHARALSIGPLEPDAVRALTREVLARSRVEVRAELLEVIAAEAQGSPFFAVELALAGAERSDDRAARGRADVADTIGERVAELSEVPRRLLELVAVAGHPVDENHLLRAVDDAGDGRRALSVLENRRLVRSLPQGPRRAITTYHDRVRAAVLGRLAPADREALHARLARALEASRDPDPLAILEHYLEANDLARAADYAYLSAETAERALAFHRAASLYRRALELSGGRHPRWVLLEKLGDALVNAGRAAEGARRLAEAADALAAAEPRDSRAVVRLKRRVAEQFLRSGLHDEGLAALRDVLSAVGLPYFSSPVTTVLSIAANRARSMIPGARSAARAGDAGADVDALEQLETCWSAGLGLSLFDPIRAFDYQVRHSLLARRAKHPAHLARAVSTEGLLLAWEGGSVKRRRGERLQADGERLAEEAGDPNITAYVMVMRAGHAWIQARFRESVAICARGESLCREQCVGAAWELANFHWLAGNSLACLGEMAELRARLPELIHEARERDDQYGLALLRLGRPNIAWLAADRPDVARRELESAGRTSAKSPFFGYLAVLAAAHVALYEGDGPRALEEITAAWSRMRTSGMLRLQRFRVDLRDLLARASLAAARDRTAQPAERRRLLRAARDHAAAIEAEDAHFTAPIVDAILGGLAIARGDRAAAEEAYERAAFGYEHLDMRLHAAAARSARGEIRGGAIGREIRAREGAWMQSRGVLEPARFARALVPLPA